MDRLKRAVFDTFTGLDLRALAETSPVGSLKTAHNVELTIDQGLRARPYFRKFALVDAASKGLYVVGDTLRCALPYPALTGPSARAIPKPPPGVVYDLLTDVQDQPYQRGLDFVSSVASWDISPYICVQSRRLDSLDTRYEHHRIPGRQSEVTRPVGGYNTIASTITVSHLPPYIGIGGTVWLTTGGHSPSYRITQRIDLGLQSTLTIDPPLTADIVPIVAEFFFPHTPTLVSLPFLPGPAVLTHAEKIWAGDILGQQVHYSSTENGPRDWLAPNDAGFLPTSLYAGGDSLVKGLKVFDGRLVVFYPETAQLWQVFPDPTRSDFGFVNNVGGAGTLYPASVANVSGDLFYFSYGGFRHLGAAQNVNGQPQEDDLGAAIQSETNLLDFQDLENRPPVALWSPHRSQYLCAIDRTVYCYTFSKVFGVTGWTKWTAPFEIDAMVEWRRRVFFRPRDSNEVWVLDPDYGDEPGFEWEVSTAHSDLDADQHIKHIRLMDLASRGKCAVEFGFDPSNPDARTPMFTIDGPTHSVGKVVVNCLAEYVSVTFKGKGPWELDRFTLRYTEGNIL